MSEQCFVVFQGSRCRRYKVEVFPTPHARKDLLALIESVPLRRTWASLGFINPNDDFALTEHRGLGCMPRGLRRLCSTAKRSSLSSKRPPEYCS